MKIIKLIQNETIKTLKKTSTKILILLSILALFGAVGLANLVMSLNNFADYYIQNENEWKNQMKEEMAQMKKTIETNSSHYDKQSIA